MNATTLTLLRIAAGTLLLCTIGPLAINPQIMAPITLQSLAVILVPIMLGWQAGTLAIIFYLLLGSLGLPVFANFNSGFGVFNGASAGFLLGFPVAGLLAGRWSAILKPGFLPYLLLFLACHIALLGFGTLGFVHAGLAAQSIAGTLAGLLPGLLIKSLAGAWLALRLRQGGALQAHMARILVHS